jgi:hypothetical protein
MHIESSKQGFELVYDCGDKEHRLPLLADNDEQAIDIARELLASDWLHGLVSIPELGCRNLQVVVRHE